MKKLINSKKGFSLISIFFYNLMFIIILIICFNVIKTVTVSNTLSSEKIRFNNEKNQIYALLEKDSSNVLATTITTDKVKANDSVNITNQTDNFNDSLKYKTSLTEESEGIIKTITEDKTFEETPEGLIYKFSSQVVETKNGVSSPPQNIEEKEMRFHSITDVKFDKIDKICIDLDSDNSIDCNYIPVTGLIDVSLYDEIDFMGKSTLNKSKRSFFFGNE